MKTLMDLNRHDCRFPVGKIDGKHAFCCEPITKGSYCAEHYARVWVPARRDWRNEKQARVADHLAGGKVQAPKAEPRVQSVDVVFRKRGSI